MANGNAYTVLVYEDECGLWLKIPEYDVQVCADDFDSGMDLLEEHLDIELLRSKARGETVLGRLARTVKRVGKDEYGPTEADLAREAWEEEGGE